MAGYTRQSTYVDGDTVDAADSNDEFDQLLAAFNSTTGHSHDGTVAEGPVISVLGDAGVATPLNKIVIDSVNNRIGFFVDDTSVAVEQVRIADGVLGVVTDNDIDLGASAAEFKNGYFDGTLYADTGSFGDNDYLTIVDNEIDVSSGNLTLDVAGDIILDADGGDVTLKDAGTTYGNLKNTAGELIVQSGSTPTTALTFSGANATFAGTLNATGGGALTGTWSNLGTVTTVDINGGTIDGSTIGGSSAAAATFTTLNATGGGALTGTWSDLGTVTTADINGGTIDGSTIGGASPAAGTFTTLTTTGNIELGNASDTTLSRTSAGVVAIEGVEVTTNSDTQTLTNKTFNLTNNTLTTTKAQLNAAVSDGTPLYSGDALVNVVDDTTPQLGGALDTNAKSVYWSKGADVASATALTLGTDGNSFDVTGTTAITSINTWAVGGVALLQFDGILTFTHHATDLILPGGGNITTAAGDIAMMYEYASGDWRCISYMIAGNAPGGGISNVVEDTTPQLGGALDTNSHAVYFSKGADVASATELLVLTDGNSFDVTGTTTITSIEKTADAWGIGATIRLQFDGALTLTHSADLKLPNSQDILTVAGDIIEFEKYAAGDWRLVTFQRDGYSVLRDQIIHAREEQPAGTTGGTFTSGADRTRTLNTVVTNTITGASLGSNLITLPAGTYDAWGRAPAYRVAQHQTALYNNTDSTDVLVGSGAYTASATSSTQTDSIFQGRFTLAAEKALKVVHRCTTTYASNGLGNNQNMGRVEVYTEIFIRKIS